MANAGLFGGLGPQGYVNSLYAPQQTALANQQQARVNTLNALVGSIMANLRAPQQDVYGAAAQDATTAANNAAQTLARLNPNASTQSMLQAIGAPQSQQDAVTNQNNTVFNGQGALGQYVGGALPAGVFAADQAARNTYLQSLPAIVGQTALMGLGHLANMASQENASLASDKAKSLQQAQSELANYVQKNQGLKLQAQKQAFNEGATQTRLQQGQQRLDLQSQMDAFNQKYKIANLNLASQKFAQTTLNQNRGYQLQLKRLGLQSKGLQLRAIAEEYKLQNGGLDQKAVTRYKSIAQGLAMQAFSSQDKTTKQPITYQEALPSILQKGVPLSIAQQALQAAGFAPGVRGAPVDVNAPSFANNALGAAGNAFAGVAGTGQKIGYLVSGAKARGLDPGAVLAVASQEGLGGGVGDNGTSFGPFQLHAGGALPAAVWARGPAFAHQWAWSPAGINYALDRIAGVAKGLTGVRAIDAIVREFERPANPGREVAGAAANYR